MSARKELAGILEQWLQLTRSEGAAIQAALWPAVSAKFRPGRPPCESHLSKPRGPAPKRMRPPAPATPPPAFSRRGGPDHFFAHAQRRGADRPIAPGESAAGIARPGGPEFAENPAFVCPSATTHGMAFVFLMAGRLQKPSWIDLLPSPGLSQTDMPPRGEGLWG